MNYTFEAYRPDGTPRRYVGLWRPPFDQAPVPAYVPTYLTQPFELWMRGEYDRPLYELEEGEA